MRIAFLGVPDFSLIALLRAIPELEGVPVAVVIGNGSHATVAHASAEAIAGGVVPGLGATRARQRLADLRTIAPSPEAERNAQAALLEVAYAFSPRIQEAGPGAVYLDMGDMSGLYDAEATVATAMDTAMGRVRLPCRVGFASNKTVARIAARVGGGVRVVPPGREALFLAPLPIEAIEPSPATAARLAGWGIHDLRGLARLSPVTITRRLGEDGDRLHRLAHGIDDLPFVTTAPTRSFEEALSFDDWTLDNLEPLMAVLGDLVDRLLERLEVVALAARAVTLTFHLDPRDNDVRHVEFAAPLRQRKAILELFRHELAARPPRAAVAGMRAVALPASPQAIQGHLFAPADPTPERLAITLARLYALVGEGRVGAPVRPARRTPGAVALAPFAQLRIRERSGPPGGRAYPLTGAPSKRRGKAPIAITALRPPRLITVELSGERLSAVYLEGRVCPVRVAAGPWQLRDGWWTAEPIDREEFDVELADGRLIRIYRDRRVGAWFWDGILG